jgi:hypothetical protein
LTDVVVERLRIACRAPQPLRAEALMLRSRLERVAHRYLPAALEGAVADAPDAGLGIVPVPLDFDPADYDDVTLALLWADRIRRVVLSASVRAPLPAQAVRAPDRLLGDFAGEGEGLSDGYGGWAAIVRSALAGDAAALEELAYALERDGEAIEAAAELSRQQRGELAAQLESLALQLATELLGHGHVETHYEGPARAQSPVDVSADAWVRGSRNGNGSASHAAMLRRAAAQVRRAAAGRIASERPRAAERERAPTVGPSPTLLSTTLGGLVLLYPWLGDFLAAACEEHRQLNPRAVRRLALARIAPDVGSGASDPLLRFLAGDDPLEPATALAPLPDCDVADEAALGVLHAFAAVLPGFERSTPEFIRREFIIRYGVLATTSKPAELLADPMPLDLALAQLPYPIGLVQLAGAPFLAVRLERG